MVVLKLLKEDSSHAQNDPGEVILKSLQKPL